MAYARKPYVVISAELLSSSVWAESASVRLVWITLLIMCDTEGYVGAALPGIATAAGVSLEDTIVAMRVLQAPDQYSRTQTNEGRRVSAVERGFLILNFTAQLDRLSSERTRARDRVRRHRARKSGAAGEGETPCNAPTGIVPLQSPQGVGIIGSRDNRVNRKQQTVGRSVAIAPDVGAFVDFYNSLLGRKFSSESHEKHVTARLKAGASLATLKLAVVGAALQPFHLGFNDRKKAYLDPATILRPDRFDGHAAFARSATWRIPDAETVWQYWSGEMRSSRVGVMVRFFRTRDRALESEGGTPLGPAAVGLDEWPPSA